jgi:hypothetical protein
MRIQFVKGVTVVKCAKKRNEFTKLPPPENIKPRIERLLAGKKGRFIVKYEVANIFKKPFENFCCRALWGAFWGIQIRQCRSALFSEGMSV